MGSSDCGDSSEKKINSPFGGVASASHTKTGSSESSNEPVFGSRKDDLSTITQATRLMPLLHLPSSSTSNSFSATKMAAPTVGDSSVQKKSSPFPVSASATQPTADTNSSSQPIFGVPPFTKPSSNINFNSNSSTSKPEARGFGTPFSSPLFGGINTSATPINSEYTTGPQPLLFSSSSSFPNSTNTHAMSPSFGFGSFMLSNPASNTSTAPVFIFPSPSSMVANFDFSRTPLHCFTNFPSSIRTFQPSGVASNAFQHTSNFLGVGQNTNKNYNYFGEDHASNSQRTFHVCKNCGHKSIWDQKWGSRVATYTPTLDPDANTFEITTPSLISISAMPVFKDKSLEELRWEDYISLKGKTKEPVAAGNESATLGQQQLLALPVLMLPVIPNSGFPSFSVAPWSSAFGSAINSYTAQHWPSLPPQSTYPAPGYSSSSCI